MRLLWNVKRCVIASYEARLPMIKPYAVGRQSHRIYSNPVEITSLFLFRKFRKEDA
ncbi:MAG TPA: hypothetical protein VFC65_16945 [Prolixibacteraceae bacterium]|nr:hypothetical protein [Prolixibacteraceae bacterium]